MRKFVKRNYVNGINLILLTKKLKFDTKQVQIQR